MTTHIDDKQADNLVSPPERERPPNDMFDDGGVFDSPLQTLEFDLRDASYSHLAIALVNDRRIRREAAAELARRLSGVYEFYEFDYLTTEQISLPRFVRALRRKERPAVVFSYNLDELRDRDPERYADARAFLNSHREDLSLSPHSVVLWVNEKTYADLRQHAADFADWTTSQAKFLVADNIFVRETAFGKLPIIEAEKLREQARRIEATLAKGNLRVAMEAELNKQLGLIYQRFGKQDKDNQALKQAALLSSDLKDYKKLEALYREHVISKHSKLTLYSVRSDAPLAVELEQVFVKLTAIEHRRNAFFRDDLEMGDISYSFDDENVTAAAPLYFKNRRPQRIVEESRVTLSVDEALRQHNNLVIVGAPGAGKTTLMKYLAIVFARQMANDKLGLDEDRLPLLLSLRDFNHYLNNRKEKGDLPSTYSATLLPDFLSEHTKQIAPHLKLPANFFHHLLDANRCVVLFDGLDEVAEFFQRARVAEVVAAIVQHYSRNRFVLTSRPRGYESESKQRLSPLCGEAVIRDFDDDDMSSFAHNWYEAVTRARLGDTQEAIAEARANADDLLKAVRADNRVRALASNPLLLSILAMVHQRNVSLPQRRADLYDESTDMLLGYWDQTKGGEAARELAEQGAIPREEKRALLSPVALWFHERGEQGLEAETDDLRRVIAEQFKEIYGDEPAKAKRRADEILQIIVDRAGLLVEKATGIYAFSHLTFQEYLAARAIADLQESDVEDYIAFTKKHLHDAWWKEVILLEVGHLSDVSKGLKRARRLTSELIKAIYQAGSRLEEVLRRDLLLAARAMIDAGVMAVDEKLREQVFDEIFILWRTTSYNPQRNECIALFKYAASTAYEERINEELIRCLKSKNASLRKLAISTIGQLGEAATTEVIAALLPALQHDNHSDLRYYAALALSNLRQAATAEVIAALLHTFQHDNDSDIRIIVTFALGNLVQTANQQVIATLLHALQNDKNNSVRVNVAFVLSRIGQTTNEQAIATLLHALQHDKNNGVRINAASALGNLVQAANEQVIAALLHTFQHDYDSNVRQSAASALGKLGQAATAEVITALLDALRNNDTDDVRQNAAWALGKLGQAPSEHAITALLLALQNDTNEDVRMNAASALGNLAQAANEQVIAALLNALRNDDDNYVRRNAALALGNLGQAENKQVIAALLYALQHDEESSVRRYAAEALDNLGQAATAEVIAALLYALQHDDDSSVRWRAAEALGNLGQAATAEVIAALLYALQHDDDSSVRRYAAEALGNLGQAASPEVIAALLDALQHDEESSVRYYAAEALGNLKVVADNPEAAEMLIAFWKEKLGNTEFKSVGGRHGKVCDIAYEELSAIAAQLAAAGKRN